MDQDDGKGASAPARSTKPIVAAIIVALIVVAGLVGWQTLVFFNRSAEKFERQQLAPESDAADETKPGQQ